MKKLINNTVSDITIQKAGVTILTTEDFIIYEREYDLWAALINDDSQLQTYITSGDLIVNDGVADLSPSDGFSYLKYPDTAFNVRFLSETERSNGFTKKNVQEAIEEAKTVVSGKLMDFEFSSTGVTFNKWLNVNHPADNSLDAPYVATWGGKIVGFSVSNKNDDIGVDIEIYVNSVLEYTWEIRNKRTAWKTSEAGLITIDQGDRISIFARKVSDQDNPASLSGEIIAQVDTFGTAEGGTQYGV